MSFRLLTQHFMLVPASHAAVWLDDPSTTPCISPQPSSQAAKQPSMLWHASPTRLPVGWASLHWPSLVISMTGLATRERCLSLRPHPACQRPLPSVDVRSTVPSLSPLSSGRQSPLLLLNIIRTTPNPPSPSSPPHCYDSTLSPAPLIPYLQNKPPPLTTCSPSISSRYNPAPPGSDHIRLKRSLDLTPAPYILLTTVRTQSQRLHPRHLPAPRRSLSCRSNSATHFNKVLARLSPALDAIVSLRATTDSSSLALCAAS